jgi:uroporphyrinogen decarboxylase
MSTNIEIVQELASIYNKPVGAYVLGPVTLAAHFMGINNLIKLAFREERSFLELLDFCVEFVLPYSQALIKEGAMLIVVLEPQVAIFSPIMYENLIQGSHEKFARRLVNPVLHVCGNTTKHVPSFSKTGCFAGLSLDAPVNLKVCLQNYDQLREVVLIGNISPVNDMLQGSKEDVKAKVMELLQDMRGTNFILSTGCDMVPDTPLDNLDAFINTALEFRANNQ